VFDPKSRVADGALCHELRRRIARCHRIGAEPFHEHCGECSWAAAHVEGGVPASNAGQIGEYGAQYT
jgi:hypothetical protein